MNYTTLVSEDMAENLKILEECLEGTLREDPFIYEACIPLLKRGKKIRPLLFMLCANSRGNFAPSRFVPLATIIELIHTATLIHDDIIDTATRRRNVETISSKYDSKIAVLIGDYLSSKAFQILAENSYCAEVSMILSKLVANLCSGEILQDRSLFKIPTLEEYYKQIELKTAFFLSCCCRLGAIVSNLDKNEIEALTTYGLSLGFAFQIIDDLLDFYGDEKITGKTNGSDLKSGVITLPVIRALQDIKHSKELKSIVVKKTIENSDIVTALNIIDNTDAMNYCKNRAIAHADFAWMCIPSALETSTITPLEQIADFVINRSE